MVIFAIAPNVEVAAHQSRHLFRRHVFDDLVRRAVPQDGAGDGGGHGAEGGDQAVLGRGALGRGQRIELGDDQVVPPDVDVARGLIDPAPTRPRFRLSWIAYRLYAMEGALPRIICFVLFALVFFAAVPAAPASALERPKITARSIDADALIKYCRAISEKDRAGSTADMRKGALNTVLCLEEVIMDITEVMFEPDAVSRKLAKEWLRNIRFSAGAFYWAIYNEHKGCFCGTMWHPVHLSANARILEELIRTMAKQWELYPPSDRK